MKTQKRYPDNQIWLTPFLGFAAGILSLLSAQLLDAALSGQLPEWRPILAYYALAGVAGAFGLSLARAKSGGTGEQWLGINWCAVHSGSMSFSLFLVPTLVLFPDSTGRWLAYACASFILFGWLAWQLRLVSRQAPVRSAPRWFEGEQAAFAPFGVVALLLLAASLICSLADQSSPAIQLANWAYGYLLLAISVATMRLLLKGISLPQAVVHFSGIVVPVAVLAFFPFASFIDSSNQTAAERQFITDVYPNFLAQKLKEGDLLISDSPTLRLSNVPRLAASLTLDPDTRGQAVWDDLKRALENRQRILWVTVPGQSRDTKGILATFLKANGCLDAISNTILPVQVYELNKPLATPKVPSPFLANNSADTFDPVQVSFGPVEMTGMRHELRVCSHDSVAVSIRWKLPAATSGAWKVSLFLLDAKERRVQRQDFYIDDPSQTKNAPSPAGITTGYYLLTVPLGTPAGSYTLGAAVYRVDQAGWLPVGTAEGVTQHSNYVDLGKVDVYRSQDVKADPWNSRFDSNLLPADTALQNGLALDGYALTSGSIIPGEPLGLALRWRALGDGLPSYKPKVALRQGTTTIAEQSSAPVDGMYPTDQWKAGEFVTDRRELDIPPISGGGPARLEVTVDGGKTVWLADINLEQITRTYQLPSMSYSAGASFRGIGDLVGYDLTPKSSTSQPFGLTLYWRSGASIDKDYVVFAQLLTPNGQLIAQSDSAPAKGSRPMRSWLPGEIITDPHSLAFSSPDYQGDAQLIVGLYDGETGERLPVEGTSKDYYLAPTRIQILRP